MFALQLGQLCVFTLLVLFPSVYGHIFPRIYKPNKGDRIFATSGRVIFNCNQNGNCQGANLVCGKFVADCMLDCDTPKACQGVTFISYASGFTRMNCVGYASCQGSSLQCGDHTGNRRKCQLNCGVRGCDSVIFKCVGRFANRCSVNAPKPFDMEVGQNHFQNGIIQSTSSLLELHCMGMSCLGTKVQCKRPFQCYCQSSKYNGACAGVHFTPNDGIIRTLPKKTTIKPIPKTISPTVADRRPSFRPSTTRARITTASPSIRTTKKSLVKTTTKVPVHVTTTKSVVVAAPVHVIVPKEGEVITAKNTSVRFDCKTGNCLNTKLTCDTSVANCELDCGVELCEFTKFVSHAYRETNMFCNEISACVKTEFECGRNDEHNTRPRCNLECGIEGCEIMTFTVNGSYEYAKITSEYLELATIVSKVDWQQTPVTLNCTKVGSCLSVTMKCPNGRCECVSPQNNTYCSGVTVTKPPTMPTAPTMPTFKPTAQPTARIPTANPTRSSFSPSMHPTAPSAMPTVGSQSPSSSPTTPTMVPSRFPTNVPTVPTSSPTSAPTRHFRSVVPRPGQIMFEREYPFIRFDCTRNFNCIGSKLSCSSTIQDCILDCGSGACDFVDFHSYAKNTTRIECGTPNSCYKSKLGCGDHFYARNECRLHCGANKGCIEIKFEASGTFNKVFVKAPGIVNFNGPLKNQDRFVYKNTVGNTISRKVTATPV